MAEEAAAKAPSPVVTLELEVRSRAAVAAARLSAAGLAPKTVLQEPPRNCGSQDATRLWERRRLGTAWAAVGESEGCMGGMAQEEAEEEEEEAEEDASDEEGAKPVASAMLPLPKTPSEVTISDSELGSRSTGKAAAAEDSETDPSWAPIAGDMGMDANPAVTSRPPE